MPHGTEIGLHATTRHEEFDTMNDAEVHSGRHNGVQAEYSLGHFTFGRRQTSTVVGNGLNPPRGSSLAVTGQDRQAFGQTR